MKKLILVSAIFFVAITSTFAFNPTHGSRTITAVTGDSAKVLPVLINLNCEVLVFVNCTTYGTAVASGNGHALYLGHSSASGYEYKEEYWTDTWNYIILYAFAAKGSPTDPIGANTAGILW